MSWTDKYSIEVIKRIRDIFKCDIFIETGTHVGINSELHSNNFKYVYTCEKIDKYYKKAKKRLSKYDNVYLFKQDSKDFLKSLFKTIRLIKSIPILYLDAHFYQEGCKNNLERFVVLQELKSLKNTNCIIIIHDFHNGLGGITYDGIDLDFKLLKPYLEKVNPNFYYYTNTLKSCNIMKIEETQDKDMIENLKYAWSKQDKTYRGILYCLPKKVNIDGLKEWN